MHRGEVDPGVSELPRGNELSRDHVNRPLIYSNCNEKLLCIPAGMPHFSEKQYTVMWQVLWLSPSPEQARPYAEASERKLQDVDFFGTSSKSRKEIEKFQSE